MGACSSVDTCLTAATTARRERLIAQVLRGGLGALRISNSMQELTAIATLGRLRREARAELFNAPAVPEYDPGAMERLVPPATMDGLRELAASAPRLQPVTAVETGLFEQSLRHTGRLVSEKT